jgi:hypothetical protein
MTAVLVAIVVLGTGGLFVVRAVDPSLSGGASLGAGFMVGCGLVSLVMLALSAAGLPWSFFVILVLLAVIAVGGSVVRRRGGAVSRNTARPGAAAVALDLCTAISVAGYALFATIARPWEWDFWAIWGLRARAEFVARGIDVAFLTSPDVEYSHPDYPPLLSLVYSFTALVRGEWDDRWLGALFVALSVALLLVVRDELRRATGSDTFSAFATLALSGAACSPWVGLADGAIVAFGTAGLLVLARGVREDDVRAFLLAGILFGLGAMTKNEGLALAVAAAVALALFRVRRLVWLVLPAALLAAPWLVWRAALHLATDVVSGGVATRVMERITDPGAFVATLASGRPDRAGFWALLAVLLLAGGREIVRRHGVMFVAVCLQLLCYVVIYAGTMHDLASHVQTSMGRISGHLAAAVGALCALATWDLFLKKTVESDSLEAEGSSVTRKKEATDE